MKSIGRIEDAVCLVIGSGLLIAGAAMVSVQLGMLAAGVLLLANAVMGRLWPMDEASEKKRKPAEVGSSKK